MKKFLLIFAAAAGVVLHAEVVDRMVAVVNDRVITWSAALEEANFRAFESGAEPVEGLEGDALHRVISKMIDEDMLEEEAESSPIKQSGDGAAKALYRLRGRFPNAAAYHAAMLRYHLSEVDVVRRVELEQKILAFVDARLRPEVEIAPEMIRDYYDRTLVPQLAPKGEPPPPLEEVKGRIEQVLTESEINRKLDEWLKDLRDRATIEWKQ